MRKETGAKGTRPASECFSPDAYQGWLKETLTRVARIAGEMVISRQQCVNLRDSERIVP
jgi:hypothetical protein